MLINNIALGLSFFHKSNTLEASNASVMDGYGLYTTSVFNATPNFIRNYNHKHVVGVLVLQSFWLKVFQQPLSGLDILT